MFLQVSETGRLDGWKIEEGPSLHIALIYVNECDWMCFHHFPTLITDVFPINVALVVSYWNTSPLTEAPAIHVPIMNPHSKQLRSFCHLELKSRPHFYTCHRAWQEVNCFIISCLEASALNIFHHHHLIYQTILEKNIQ